MINNKVKDFIVNPHKPPAGRGGPAVGQYNIKLPHQYLINHGHYLTKRQHKTATTTKAHRGPQINLCVIPVKSHRRGPLSPFFSIFIKLFYIIFDRAGVFVWI